VSIIQLNVGSAVWDSYPMSVEKNDIILRQQCSVMKGCGVVAMVGYLGPGLFSKGSLQVILENGIGFMPVTVAGEYLDGPNDEIKQLEDLGVAKKTTVWLDFEGVSAWEYGKKDAAGLISQIETWAAAINAAGYRAGLYCGVPHPLTSEELWKLRGITRYWKGMGRHVDRYGNLSEPSKRGWCMTQFSPSFVAGHHLVDANMVGADYRGGLPSAMFL
jgi:hypothetical protein